MSLNRLGLGPLVAGALMVVFGTTAQAGELDRCRTQMQGGGLTVADSDLGLDFETDGPELAAEADARDAVPLGDLRLVTDFHPETDRWTERNNRIRISFWQGVWFFASELDIRHDYVMGLRLAWEVPGFIAIRIDSGWVGWSRLEVKIATPNNANSSRHMSGQVHSHYLSLGIFNPELSIEGLAFWAGFGGGFWIYDYSEDSIVNNVDGTFQDEISIAGAIFIELDYEISDIFHVGVGIREHFILAEHTDEGRFYELNNVDQSFDGGRNDKNFDDMAVVTEITFNLSILF